MNIPDEFAEDEEFEGIDYDPDMDIYPDPYDCGYDGDG
jgi:hypothetical protein